MTPTEKRLAELEAYFEAHVGEYATDETRAMLKEYRELIKQIAEHDKKNT